MNINEVLSAPRSPWQRTYVERVIGSIRRECVDHVIVFDEESLRRTWPAIEHLPGCPRRKEGKAANERALAR
jgi:Integrase core domain